MVGARGVRVRSGAAGEDAADRTDTGRAQVRDGERTLACRAPGGAGPLARMTENAGFGPACEVGHCG
ncbi:hypothetical protein GCM10010342_07900 [Streptomyces anulatus]|nr:hypothetical protein GCM10010342_07900 [Streptomyces anulatus]